MCSPWKNNREFFETVDSLPHGPSWQRIPVTKKGDLVANGDPQIEEMELWMRDPLECIKDLIGNPLFKKVMKYKPERHWRRGKRVYSEMWTGDWWWKMQVGIHVCA